MHLRPQITQPRDRFQTEHPNGPSIQTILTLSWQLLSDNSALWCSPRRVLWFLVYSLTKAQKTCIHTSQMAFNSVCIICMHIWTTGTWDRIFYLSHAHVICILLKYTYLQKCLMGRHSSLGSCAQLSSHDASWHYALSVCHTGWRWMLPVSIPTQHLLELHLDILGTWYSPHFGIH